MDSTLLMILWTLMVWFVFLWDCLIFVEIRLLKPVFIRKFWKIQLSTKINHCYTKIDCHKNKFVSQFLSISLCLSSHTERKSRLNCWQSDWNWLWNRSQEMQVEIAMKSTSITVYLFLKLLPAVLFWINSRINSASKHKIETAYLRPIQSEWKRRWKWSVIKMAS